MLKKQNQEQKINLSHYREKCGEKQHFALCLLCCFYTLHIRQKMTPVSIDGEQRLLVSKSCTDFLNIFLIFRNPPHTSLQ